jgi:pimeloyl-ACP methyl ester carboxylesterase
MKAMPERARPIAGEDQPLAVGAPERDPVARVFRYRSQDGLTLFARDYGDRLSPWLPVVCLPGLSRSSRDFDELARALAGQGLRPRRVLAFDYRGRGRSQWDHTSDNYNPLVEMSDVFDGMAALGVPRAAVVGTSRGGIIGMLMAVARPTTVAALVLNDIGPVIEPRGLARIKTYVGHTPAPDDWDDAERILRRLHGAQFTALTDKDWQAYTRLTWRDDNGRPAGDYDPALARTLDGIEFDKPVPTLWKEFRMLAAVPVLAIRGENSDLLSPGTLTAMAAAHPRLESITVPGEGHAPLLFHSQLIQRIATFLTSVEGGLAPDAVVPREPAAYDSDAAPTRGIGSV